MSENISSIGVCAFAFCNSLSSIKIPNATKTLEDGTFINCENLESIEFGSDTKTIRKNVFRKCSEYR